MPEESIQFDRAADYYDETRGFPPGVVEHVAQLIARAGALGSKSRILEIGVGTGRIALPLSAHVKACYGIDLSVEMMKRLQSKRRKEPVYLIRSDATELPFAEATLDAVVAVHVFHLIPNWRKALLEIRRVLRPGGALLSCWSQEGGSESKALWEVWKQAVPPSRRTPAGVHPRDNPDFLLAEGWAVEGNQLVYEFTRPFVPQKLLDGLRRRVWSRLWRLSDSELQAGVAAVESAMNRLYENPETPLPEAARLYVQAYVPTMLR